MWSRAWVADGWAMYVLTHIIALYVCMLTCGCLCLSGSLRSCVMEREEAQTRLQRHTNVSFFTCLSLAYLQQMRNCALHIRVARFIFRSCRLFAGCVCGDCRRSSFICTTACDSNVHLNHNIDLLSFLVMIPPKAACVCVCVCVQ